MALTSRRFNAVDVVYRVGSIPFIKKFFTLWYPLMTRRLDRQDVLFLNWGYEEDPPMGIPLTESDEPNRYCIQLYHRTAAQIDLEGMKVLEVSCGHGGGASYIVRTFRPAFYTGLELNQSAVEFCRRRHILPGLDFVHGDALDMPFPDQAFDVVVNIEASHIYLDCQKFFGEVARVLRQGGHFLYADVREPRLIPGWEADLAAMPMHVESQEVINAEVLRGLTKNSPRTSELIRRNLPVFMRRFGREFAVVEGSWMFRDLQSDELTYRVYHLVRN